MWSTGSTGRTGVGVDGVLVLVLVVRGRPARVSHACPNDPARLRPKRAAHTGVMYSAVQLHYDYTTWLASSSTTPPSSDSGRPALALAAASWCSRPERAVTRGIRRRVRRQTLCQLSSACHGMT